MDFFERQERARRGTKWLVLYFGLGVASLILVIYAAALLLFGVAADHRPAYETPAGVSWWNVQLFSGVALGTLAVVVIGSLFKASELAQGGSAVALMLGGRLVNPNTTDPDERKLLNVTEEMALASGIPVPQVYVLPAEQGINAFAAGHTPSDAALGVTAGAMRLLNRDELQGVIGHEFSHVLNGDMRLNLRLIGWIFGIMCLAVIGRVLLQVRGSSGGSNRRQGQNPLPLFGLVLLIVGWIGVFFGRLIQAAVSRERERLADASSVQFTRNPLGLASALKKIGGLEAGSRLRTAHAAEASHLFFGNALRSSFLGLWATHPPLEERIRALDPAFDGKYPAVIRPDDAPAPAQPGAARRAMGFGFPGAARGLIESEAALSVPPVIATSSVLAHTGAPTPDHVVYAEQLRDSIPAALRESAREPLGACAVVYALLLSPDQPEVRQKQLEGLRSRASDAALRETLRVEPAVREVAHRAKLPIIDLALPALRHLSPAQFQQFDSAVAFLVECDGEIDLFEYVLQKAVIRHLEPHFTSVRRGVTQYYSLKPLLPDCAVLLSAVARAGQEDPQKILEAFRDGANPLAYAAQAGLELLPPEQCDLSQVDAALGRLSAAVPHIKKKVLSACAATVSADGLIQEIEAEMLRAIADALDCPLPPFLSAQP